MVVTYPILTSFKTRKENIAGFFYFLFKSGHLYRKLPYKVYLNHRVDILFSSAQEIHFHYLYSGQGHIGMGAYPGNTGLKAGIGCQSTHIDAVIYTIVVFFVQ